MARMKVIWRKIIDFLDGFLAYVLTVVGIIFSAYIPLLKSSAPIKLELEIGRVVLASIVALLIVGRQEALPKDPAKNKDAREGRRANFALRMVNALSHGIAWSQLMQLGA